MLGKPVPDFSLPSTGSRSLFRLSSRYTAFRRAQAKPKFPFELLSDRDEAVFRQFGVMKLQNLYGKQVRGIERSTFVIDEEGMLARAWRGVKVPGHIQEVLNFAQAL